MSLLFFAGFVIKPLRFINSLFQISHLALHGKNTFQSASVLAFALDNGIEALSESDLETMLRFANAAAYLVTTKKGAIRSMSERGEVERILDTN